jgi:hypothetical protein
MTALISMGITRRQIGNGRFPPVDAVPGGAGQWPEWGNSGRSLPARPTIFSHRQERFFSRIEVPTIDDQK